MRRRERERERESVCVCVCVAATQEPAPFQHFVSGAEPRGARVRWREADYENPPSSYGVSGGTALSRAGSPSLPAWPAV
jgi:hypothetical protein